MLTRSIGQSTRATAELTSSSPPSDTAQDFPLLRLLSHTLWLNSDWPALVAFAVVLKKFVLCGLFSLLVPLPSPPECSLNAGQRHRLLIACGFNAGKFLSIARCRLACCVRSVYVGLLASLGYFFARYLAPNCSVWLLRLRQQSRPDLALGIELPSISCTHIPKPDPTALIHYVALDSDRAKHLVPQALPTRVSGIGSFAMSSQGMTRKRPAPGTSPKLHPQLGPVPNYAPSNSSSQLSNEQFLQWGQNPSANVIGPTSFGDVASFNSAGHVVSQDLSGPVTSSSNQLTRRQQANQVATRNRGYDQVTAILEPNANAGQGESGPWGESLEELYQRALAAKREAQAKRKQIPPFVQKLSRYGWRSFPLDHSIKQANWKKTLVF